MARTVGSKNINNSPSAVTATQLFQMYWNNPDKIALMNARLEQVMVTGGDREALSAITLVLNKIIVAADKQIENDTAVAQKLSSAEMLEAIRSIRQSASV